MAWIKNISGQMNSKQVKAHYLYASTIQIPTVDIFSTLSNKTT